MQITQDNTWKPQGQEPRVCLVPWAEAPLSMGKESLVTKGCWERNFTCPKGQGHRRTSSGVNPFPS